MSRDGYSWDEDTNQANIEKHGISFERASIVLERGNPVHGVPYERNGEQRVQSVGQVNGETIAVIHTEENDKTQIISAHKGRNLEAQYTASLEAQGGQTNQIFDPESDAWRKLDRAQQANNRDDYLEQQQRDRQELEAAKGDPSKDIEEIKERQRAEAIAERAPRLEHDQAERAELAASFAEVTREANHEQPERDAPQAEPTHATTPDEQVRTAADTVEQVNTPGGETPALAETMATAPTQERGEVASKGQPALDIDIAGGLEKGAIMVLDAVADTMERLVDFESDFLFGDASPPPTQSQVDEIRAQRRAAAALETISENLQQGPTVDAGAIRSLTSNQLRDIMNGGDEVLRSLASYAEAERERDHDWERGRER